MIDSKDISGESRCSSLCRNSAHEDPDCRPSLLDLFCGAGGAAVGYNRAGFRKIVGVDHRPQPRYPFEFVQADALEFLTERGEEFDFIHASPPCQRFSQATFCRGRRDHHKDLLTPTLDILRQLDCVWVVENVPFAPIGFSIELCGLWFGLKVFRHRRFASSAFLFAPPHLSHRGKRVGENGFVCVAGHGGQGSGWSHGKYRKIPSDHRTKSAWARAIGIDWMTRGELAQAIPPACTQWIGRQLLAWVEEGEA